MKCERSNKWLTLEFEEQEKELLLFSLEEVEELYAQEEPRLRTPSKNYWKGELTRSQESEKELGESNQDLHDARWAWKAERLGMVQKWLAEEGSMKCEGGGVLVLDEAEAEQFICVLNDRRLLLGIEHHLDERLMSANPADVGPPEVQQAVWEVHFLSIVQQVVLETLSKEQ